MQKQKDIKIIPIFDQSIGNIWHEFTYIEQMADMYKYKFVNDADDIMASHKTEWEVKKYNFAFGAYDGAKLVGFASGYREDKDEIYLHNLYVNPHYQGHGIGSRLLAQSENAAKLVAKNMTLIALKESVASFYKKYGYATYDNRYMFKKLEQPYVGVVPVFKPMGGLKAKIKTDFDKSIVKQCKNCPVFVYVSFGNEIDGVAVKTPDGKDIIWTNKSKPGMVDFYQKQLSRALENAR